MSTDPTNLLRMLEPAVRPDGRSSRVSGPAQRSAESAPFEARSFDQLLLEAKQADVPEQPARADQSQTASRSLASLADMTHIENASLRQQLEARGGGSQPGADTTTQQPDSFN